MNILWSIIFEEGTFLQEHIGQKIVDFDEELKDKRHLQQFFGMVNQIRENVPNLANHSKLLNRKLEKEIFKNLPKLELLI